MKFKPDQITDSKRLVRGENIRQAQGLLRVKHGHFGQRRILMLAGGEPVEEINSLREFFKSGCHITCVDTDPLCLEAAIDAGADEVLNTDIHDWTKSDQYVGTRKLLTYPPGIHGKEYEIIDLDFCGGLTDQVRETVNAYKYLLTDEGVMMLTFSYGRDVVERFIAFARGGNLLGPTHPDVQALVERGLSESLIGRVLFAGSNKGLKPLQVLFYQGKQMPMCSMLFQRGNYAGMWTSQRYGDPPRLRFPRFTIVEPVDLDLMFQVDALPAMYASSPERIEAARRSRTALKATATRRENLLGDARTQVSMFPTASNLNPSASDNRGGSEQ